jgi:hypothetical protein
VKETPIIMSGDHPTKIIAGTKTQTRRVIKGEFCFGAEGAVLNLRDGLGRMACPYGEKGDRLWVRESWAVGACANGLKPSELHPGTWLKDNGGLWYTDAEPKHPISPRGKMRNAFFMPRWAARIISELTEVRVQRVQEISEEDAVAEGVICRDDGLECTECPWRGYEDSTGVTRTDEEDWQFICPVCSGECAHHPLDEQARQEYRTLWDSINGKRAGGIYAWARNPFVWCLSFKQL